MSKRDFIPSQRDLNDYPSLLKVLLSFALFPFGFYFLYKTPKEFTFTRKVYIITSLLSAFIYFVIIVAVIVQ